MFNENKQRAKVMSLWTKHLKGKKPLEQKIMLSSDEAMANSATEFYAIMPNELQNHYSLESMIAIAIEQRQKKMKKEKAQIKTFGRVINKGSSDFSQIDMTEFGIDNVKKKAHRQK